MNIILKASVRDAKQNINDLRKRSLVPAVLYGHGIENVNLEVDKNEFDKIYKQAGETTIIELVFGKEKRQVLINDVQQNYMKGRVDHIDFYQVRMDEEISAEIELEFIGESPAVKNLGGVLVKALHKVEVEALPADLPHSLKVDLSKLIDFETTISVKDLEIPKGVKVLDNLESVIALATPPRSEEAPVETQITVDSVKVEGEEKRAKKQSEKEQQEKS